jgi:hypothetical protein
MPNDKIAIKGLAEFSRALGKFDKDRAKLIRTANNSAADILIKKTVPVIPRKTGAAANSLTARSTRTSVRIAVGGTKAPYYPWLDFGGKTGRNKSVVRPFYKSGRYLYVQLGKNKDAIAYAQLDALADVARGSGLEVS